MDRTEREIIDGLFDKLGQAERQGGPRDVEAERLIGEHLQRQPAAPYYMAQAIVVQEQALAAAQARIAELERDLASRPAGGSFLSGLFGGGTASAPPAGTRPTSRPGGPWGEQPGRAPSGPWGAAMPGPSYGYGRAGEFMGGALQTAMAVAGGIVAGNLIADLLTPDAAEAADAGPDDENLHGSGAEDPGYEDTGADEAGGFDEDPGGFDDA